MIRTSLFAALLGSVLSTGALAQTTATSAAPLKDKEAVTFNEIERGFYVRIGGGPFFVLNPPAVATSDGGNGLRPFSSGQMAQLEAGIDLSPTISAGVFVMGSANREGSNYQGVPPKGVTLGTATGDFSTLVPGATLKASVLGFADAQGTQRTWIYVRGGVGFVRFFPAALLGSSDVLIFAGPGIEYFTRLRHFSIGVEVTGSFLALSQTFAFAVTPMLRYAF